MAKYAMLNCWNDLNKGDLGIMIASIEEIKRQDPKAEIIGISCFDKYDDNYLEMHEDLKKFIPEIYPAVFGVYGLLFFGHFRQNLPFKIIAMIYEDFRYFMSMHFSNDFGLRFLTKDERDTLEAIKSCDVSFCKGGTIFMDYGSKRGRIALRRVCRFYDLLSKFKCNYFLLGQSFGPIGINKELQHTNRVIENANKVYLRETQCRDLYPHIKLYGENVCFSNDIAFLLDTLEPEHVPFDENNKNVGITVRSFGDDEAYINCMVKTFSFLKTKGYHINIFQQVAMDNEPDNKTAERIINSLSPDVKQFVKYHTQHYLPQELKWMYGKMDLFIGTRLHSTIFSMAAGTVTIGMNYHGTKATGIFDNIGVAELVIDNPISFEKIRNKIEYVEMNKNDLFIRMNAGVEIAKNQAKIAISELVDFANES
jgi:colanic acid/amylovoran biosynthesis protein